MIKRRYLFLIFAGLIALLAVLGVNFYSGFVEIPRSLKILDCTGSISKTNFTAPKGRNFCLVIASQSYEKNSLAKMSYSGVVKIMGKDGIVREFPINSELSTECNWLRSAGYDRAFILTGFKNTNSLFFINYIKSGGKYELQIKFDGIPSGSNSVWLYFVQAHKDWHQ